VTRIFAATAVASVLTLLVGSVFSAAAGYAAQAPWPMALHDNRHSGTSVVDGPTSGHILWSRDLEGNITPGPAVGPGGSIYVATNSGVLDALDPTTGATEWTYNGGMALGGETDLSTTPLVLPSGDILWPGSRETLFEISPTGALLWSHRFSSQPLSPTLSGTRAYVEQMGGALSAFDIAPATPQLAWSLSVGTTSYGSPVVAPNGTIITTAGRHVIDVADAGSKGRVVWRYTTAAPIEVSASVGADGTVVVSTNDRDVYALEPDGALKWKSDRGTESYSSSSISGSLAYYGDNSGTLHVVREKSGTPVATDSGTKGIWAAQAIDGRGDVYFGTQGKQIYGFGPHGAKLFDITASAPIDSYPALTANGVLIIGDEAGTLYAIG
jgi:outer membrane protein assembly factor BamB